MRRAAALLVLAGVLALGACGEEQAGGPAGTAWRWCRVVGLAGARGVAVHGGDLVFVAGGGDRSVYALSREALADGAEARVRVLAQEVDGNAPLMGRDDLALQGYRLEHLGSLPVDLQGIAVQAPGFVYLAERSHRVVLWGQLTADAAGRVRAVRLRGAFTVPGASRTDVASGDWRDHGPGLAGLAAVSNRRRTEDLYVVDEGAPDGASVRIQKVNRYGSALGVARVRHALEGAPHLEGLSWHAGRFVLLRGGEASALHEAPEAGDERTVDLGPAEPVPALGGARDWRGAAHAEDGTLYLVSGGDPAVVAWRRPAR